MPIRLIPRLKPYYNHRELLAALRFSRGNIEKYEREFAQKFECKHGVMFPYGRSGLYSLLKIWDLHDAEIICPAYTCVVVPHAIVLSGNVPVFVDCAESTFNMSYAGIEKAITEKTRAVIVTHLFGYPMDVHRANEIVRNAEQKYGHKIYIVQDAAHSFGARWKGELVTKFGDAALFGLNISKIINSIFGGMIITNDEDTYKQLFRYREENFIKPGIKKSIKRFLYLVAVYFAFNVYVYGLVNWLERKGFLNSFLRYYDEGNIDFPDDWNHWPVGIEARVGIVQLNKYDEIILKRIARARKYIEEFKDNKEISILPFQVGATYSHFVGLVENRGHWVSEYHQKGIQLGIIIEYSIPYMSAYARFKTYECPVSKKYSDKSINFPIFPALYN